ncbi:MAG TPA: chemotaxis protein CheA, partial [Patescibacteria group bacterium]|nr:chemotaxis protein CheA [Patescibacteria group bacterium]
GEDLHSKKSKTGKTVRVDIDRLDNLMNLVSELIIIKTRLEGAGADTTDEDMGEAVEYLERITTNLHDAVMKVRMVPIERVFNRFPRMVRDLSKELGKDITLSLSGEETELDRTVIDEIGDPLIHLIRNSIDHGIEDKEERTNKGKAVTGNLYLRAYQDGNSVVIEVEDDGNGIDIGRVKKKAIEKGIISQSEADALDEKASVELLFKPGFSTAEKISDISGRGVGLDVVKTKIESLNGVVEVETVSGKGSKFIIRLPLTLAIIQALMVTVGNEKYAIPLNVIRDITTINADSIRNIHGQEVVLNRESVLPIIRLNKVLDVEGSTAEAEDEMTIVVVKKGEKHAGFIVDSLIGQQEIVIKTLGKYLSGIRFIAGATILGDGQVALIVDTNSLI